MARLFSARTLILGGIAIGAIYARRNQEQVKGLVDKATPGAGGGGFPAPAPAPAQAPEGVAANEPGPAETPAVANADVAGPPENTATHVPAPEPAVHEPGGGIDEAAEEAAAAAEAANIGGVPEDYPSEEDPSIPIDESLRPLEEAGEGYSEGLELAESDLVENAEPAAGDPIEAERQIDEIIEAQDDPFSGEVEEATLQMPIVDEAETEQVARDLGEPEAEDVPALAPDPLDAEIVPDPTDAPPPTGAPAADVPPPPETPPAEKSSAVWRISGDEVGGERSETEQATVESDAVEEDEGPTRTQDGA